MLSYAQKRWIIVFFSLLAFLSIFPLTSNAQTCSGEGSVSKACIKNPEGLLAGNEKAAKSVSLVNWVFGAVSLAGAIMFGMKGAKKLSDEDYVASVGPFSGAIICGITLWLAGSITM